MTSDLTNCPRCEAPQSFKPRKRKIEDNDIEVFIYCTTCRWEQVIRRSTEEIEGLLQRQGRMRAQAFMQQVRHEQVSDSTSRKLEQIAQQIAVARQRLGKH